MKQLRVLLLPPWWDVTSPGWRETMWRYVSYLSKDTTRWQGLGVEPHTFRSEVQRASHYTATPSQRLKVAMLQTLCPSPTESNNDHTSNMYFSTKNVNRYSVPNYQIRHDKCAREIRYISETTACSTASFKKAPPFKKNCTP